MSRISTVQDALLAHAATARGGTIKPEFGDETYPPRGRRDRLALNPVDYDPDGDQTGGYVYIWHTTGRAEELGQTRQYNESAAQNLVIVAHREQAVQLEDDAETLRDLIMADPTIKTLGGSPTPQVDGVVTVDWEVSSLPEWEVAILQVLVVTRLVLP